MLGVAGRYAESLPICEQALALARDVGAREAEVRALTVRGGDLAYLGRGDQGLADLRRALQLAEEIGDHIGLERAYGWLTDVLTMLGRLRESARLGQEGLEVTRRYGIDSPLEQGPSSRSSSCSLYARGSISRRPRANQLREVWSRLSA